MALGPLEENEAITGAGFIPRIVFALSMLNIAIWFLQCKNNIAPPVHFLTSGTYIRKEKIWV